jgi:hypothetical protein
MCVELILQAILHENDYVQWSFIFNRTQNLETSIIITLAMWLWPRQGLAKVQAKNEAWESHFMLPEV